MSHLLTGLSIALLAAPAFALDHSPRSSTTQCPCFSAAEVQTVIVAGAVYQARDAYDMRGHGCSGFLCRVALIRSPATPGSASFSFYATTKNAALTDPCEGTEELSGKLPGRGWDMNPSGCFKSVGGVEMGATKLLPEESAACVAILEKFAR